MRFRLKTPFMTMARDQIRGGIWYKVRYTTLRYLVYNRVQQTSGGSGSARRRWGPETRR